ncbi:hypothetical protein DENSPDRAFT_887192 [Dentipellis sp. KUC8613]|nr:hypothetical protein DENSPDRAFT_887192 [Dentipellis sp. KUC8613]
MARLPLAQVTHHPGIVSIPPSPDFPHASLEQVFVTPSSIQDSLFSFVLLFWSSGTSRTLEILIFNTSLFWKKGFTGSISDCGPSKRPSLGFASNISLEEPSLRRLSSPCLPLGPSLKLLAPVFLCLKLLLRMLVLRLWLSLRTSLGLNWMLLDFRKTCNRQIRLDKVLNHYGLVTSLA